MAKVQTIHATSNIVNPGLWNAAADDPEIMIEIKRFMALYGIADIKMRMLKVSELLPIQGFPKDYKLDGNQTDQKKFIGNSVVPHVVKSWTEAMEEKIRIAA